MSRGRGLRGIAVSTVLFLYAPIAILILFSFNSSRVTATWTGWSLRWYQELLNDRSLLVALENSLLVACVSTAIAVALGVAASVGLDQVSPRRRRIIEGGFLVPLVVPEIMLGIALMLFFAQVRWPPSLQTVTIGHVVFNVPVVVVIVGARLAKLDPRLIEAAYDLGATPWQAFRRVTLPLLMPAIVGAALIAFTLSLDDFIVTFFTGGPGSTTLPLKVYSMIKSGVSPEINALSAILVLVSMVLVTLSMVLQRTPAEKPFSMARVWLVLVCLVVTTTGCQQQADQGRPTLHYFTWSDYAGSEIIAAFEREAAVEVVVDTFGSNEELLAKLQTSTVGYDVVVPSDFMVAIMIRLGLLAELDLTRISNVDSMVEVLHSMPVDPEHRYSIPYLWGTVGIGYDSAVVTPEPDSWDILWDERYKGRISILNDQREVFGMALRSIGASMNSRDPALIHQAKEKLLAQKRLVKTYTSDHYDQLLAAGEVVLAHGWGGAIARAAVTRPSIKYVVPKEGATIWADCLVVLETSRHKDLAMQFINHLLDRQVAARTTNRLLFASSNREARALADPAVRENPAVYPPGGVASRVEWMQDVGDAIRAYDRGWTELKLR